MGLKYLTGGYTLTGSIPVTAMLTVNYYDGYSFISNSTLNYDTSQEQNGYTPQYTNAKGLLTGTRVYHLNDPNASETTALYYDKYGRVVQTRATNHLGGYDLTYNALDFTGKPTKTLKNHNIAGQASVVELYTYDYDKAQRPTTTTYSLNGGGAVTLASNTYDDLGRLTAKRRHANGDTETYAYNVRSWSTSINSGGFTENLYYNTNLPSGASANYNGNIAYSTWTYNGVNKGYAYTYDNLNRLTLASFKQGSSSQAEGSFNEQFTFDKQGNISALQRKKDNALIDNLVITPNGNQLASVIDYAGSQNQYSTKEYNNKAGSNEFAYDANGNMTKDLDRNIVAIQYNMLNLPDVVQFKNGNQIKNSYNASGQKLGTEYFTQLTNITPLADGQIISQSYNPGTVDQTGNAYIGAMEYNTQNGNSTLTSLSRIYNAEGYVENLSNPQYYYYRKDHLGDNREVWLANTGETVQRTQYYPSGLPWASNSGDNPSKQQRKYNGKEFVEMHGYDTYDYGARGYYAAIGGWPTVDPLAEKYYSISPYVYCAGNPVRYVDIKGQWIKDVTGARVKVTYNENGSLSFSKNADVNTIRTANAINLTESGRSMLKFADNSSIGVRLKISSNTITSTDSDGKTHTTNGETLQGNNNKSDNFGRVVNKDGTYGIKEATITVYEGSLKEQIKEGSGSKLEGLTMDQAIGAVAGHEIVHATNKGEINKDIKAENSKTKRTDGEVKPNNVEQNIIDENKKPK